MERMYGEIRGMSSTCTRGINSENHVLAVGTEQLNFSAFFVNKKLTRET